jgi:hypothetical protein
MVKLFAKNSATLPAKSGPNRILGNRLMRQPIGFHQILNTNSILPNLQKHIVLRSSWTIEIKGTFRSEKLFQGEFKVLSRSIKKSPKKLRKPSSETIGREFPSQQNISFRIL